MVPEPKKPLPTPTSAPQTAEYVVQPGDTLSAIAQKFGTTVDDLIRLNHLSSEAIQVGMVLKVPQVAHPTPAPTYQTYVVQPGDTLFSLAERFGTTVGELKSLNNLTSDTLRVGQTLRVPQPAQTYATYVVKQGDTLSSIATAFNVTPEEIARVNNLSNEDLLRVGQTLRIPMRTVAPTSRPVRYHVVRAGETLTSIAQRYGVTVAQIQAANGLADLNKIYVGQRLRIP
jgi:LysM repeat protein